ncbi:DotH/IcmK family type IV secretion protein [Pseudomonas sp. RP23018S]|uniref:DotH/IcmK family type IV secretion protein n=1 Tax=Pseudomonas sp. RP23018S TaxID=3096037 RepID=UPI002ACA8D0F|nr:DotH/IcmK family type IV secretion protein [Pseudomonas sp. RP23018S]MDZ5605233.1 DotH/IcmK family type IV secretion protein [Pseudomonas sp. RP23018S]
MKSIALSVALSAVVASGVALADSESAVVNRTEAADEQRNEFVSHTETILGADPRSIIKARRAIIQNSAAQRVPIVETFEDLSEPLLDIEETFEVSSEPSAKTPIINIARYMSSNVNFVDAYGNPWPVRKVQSYLSGLVDIQKASDPAPQTDGDAKGGNNGIDPMDPQAGSFTLTALKHGATGNITVFLVGRSRPVTIMLEGQAGVFHKEATMKLFSEVGPQTDLAKVSRGDEVTVGTRADADLNNTLYGIGPIGSQAMVVEGGEGRAWTIGKWMYLQTPLSVFSPRVEGATHANGKYRAYKLPASTVVMASNEEGKTVTLKIKRIAQSDALSETMNGSGF